MRPIIKSLLLILSVAVPSGISASIRHTVNFDRSALELTTDTLNGAEYIVPLYKGLSNAAEPGYPELPYKVLSFSVPYNAVDFTVSQVDADGERIALFHPIRHAQNPEISGRNYMAEYIGPKTEVYSSNSGFPELTVTYSGEGYDAGINKYVSVMVSPVIYLPGENVLVFNNSVTFVIDWRITDDFSGYPVQPVMPRRYSDVEESLQQMAEYVENPASLRKNAVASSRFRVADNNPEYEYIIVTAREFGDAFQRLIAMRRMRGYSSKLFYIEDIVSDPKYADGDVVSGINDDAGKLRAFLTDAYTNHGTRFVLLGGKPPYMPIRYAKTAIFSDTITDPIKLEEMHVPTDFYFAELNNRWDRNENGLFGELGEITDQKQELFVGRLLCTSDIQIENYLDKVSIYEQMPGKGDTSYLLRSVLYFSYSMRHRYNSLKNNFEKYYKDPIIEYQPGLNADSIRIKGGADLINLFNEVLPGFIDIHGHGHPGGISLIDNHYVGEGLKPFGVNALDKDKAYLEPESQNGLDCMTNKFYPSWSYCISCDVMPFDDFECANTELNIGESYTIGKNYGGIAFLGNTRVGFSTSSDALQKDFYNQMSDSTEIGLWHALSKGKFPFFAKYGTYHHALLTHNLLGDPSIKVWLNEPKTLTLNASANTYNIGFDFSSRIYLVEASIVDDSLITKRPLFEDAINRVDLSPNTLYTVIGDSILPVKIPLELQNISIEEKKIIVCGEVVAGKNVNQFHPNGDVLFTSNADIKIISNGKVRLNQGVKFLKGCKVEIQCDEPVELHGAIFNSGSSVVIEAPALNMLPNTKIEQGANFKFIPTKDL